MTKRIVEIKDNPALDDDKLSQILGEGFSGKYTVYPSKLMGVGVIVKRSGFSGVGLKIKRENGITSLIMWGMLPSFLARFLTAGGLLSYLFFYRRLKIKSLKYYFLWALSRCRCRY